MLLMLLGLNVFHHVQQDIIGMSLNVALVPQTALYALLEVTIVISIDLYLITLHISSITSDFTLNNCRDIITLI